MEGLWGLAGRMGRRPNRPEGRFQRAEPAAAAERCRACGGQGLAEGAARRAARRSRAQAAFGRRPHPEEGVPCGPYFAVGRGWKRSGMRAGRRLLLAVGQGVWYH